MPLRISRRRGQRVYIDGPAIIQYEGGGVMRITADDTTTIIREELMDEVQRGEVEDLEASAAERRSPPRMAPA